MNDKYIFVGLFLFAGVLQIMPGWAVLSYGKSNAVKMSKFAFMNAHLPTKSLFRLNLLLALVISGAVYLFLSNDTREAHPVLYTIMTAIVVSLIGFANTLIMIRLLKFHAFNSVRFKVYRYASSYAASLGAYLLIWPVFAHLSGKIWSYTDLILLGTFVLGSSLVNSLIIILQDFIVLQTQKVHAELELSQLKTAHAEAANLLLKQQIHPHFLFNALNTLKALYKKDPVSADTYIVHLANFLRASVFSHTSKVATVGQEMSLLGDYLQMQQIRFADALHFTSTVPGQIYGQFCLPSFSLQPLLENAIKHNELTRAAPLHVSLSLCGDRLVMSNNLQRKQHQVDSANHGLANLRERYRLLSGDQVFVTEDEISFSVSIKLLTDEYSDHRR